MLTEFSKERRRIEYQKNVINRAKNRARSNIRAWLKAGGIERVEEEVRNDVRNTIDEWKSKQKGAPEWIARTAAEVMYAERKVGLIARKWVVEEINKKAKEGYEEMVIFENIYRVVKELIKEIN